MKRLKDFVENYDNNKHNTVTFTLQPVKTEDVPEDIKRIGEQMVEEVNDNMKLRDKLLDKYEQELENLDAMIAHHEAVLFDLRKEKDFYERIINDINED